MQDCSVKGRFGRKLTPDDVAQIRALRDKGFSYHAIGSMFGVSDQNVGMVVRNEIHKPKGI
jgi:transcriptional regulator